MLVVVTGLTCMLMLIDCCVKWTVGTIYTIYTVYTDTRMLGNISIIVLNTAPADTTHTASTSHCSTQGRHGMGKCIISLAKYFTVIVLDHKLYDSKTKLYHYFPLKLHSSQMLATTLFECFWQQEISSVGVHLSQKYLQCKLTEKVFPFKANITWILSKIGGNWFVNYF